MKTTNHAVFEASILTHCFCINYATIFRVFTAGEDFFDLLGCTRHMCRNWEGFELKGISPCLSYFALTSPHLFFFLIYSISSNKSSSRSSLPPFRLSPSPTLSLTLWKGIDLCRPGLCTARRRCRLVNKFILCVSQVKAQALSSASVCVIFRQEEREIDCPLFM